MGINLCHAIQVTIMINHVLLKTNSKSRDCNSTEVKKNTTIGQKVENQTLERLKRKSINVHT